MNALLISGFTELAADPVFTEYLSSSRDTYESARTIGGFIGMGIRVAAGIALAKEAKKYGLSPVLHFLFCLFLGLIGVIISLLIISGQKKKFVNQFPNGMPYGQPMQQPYVWSANGQRYDLPRLRTYSERRHFLRRMRSKAPVNMLYIITDSRLRAVVLFSWYN